MSKIIVVLGTNASGKSSLGIDLANRFNGEIISADSRQVYKGMDLGSGKVTQSEMKGVRHYLIDVVEPGEWFTVVDYKKLAEESIECILNNNKQPFIVGGTGLYIDSVINDFSFADTPPDYAFRDEMERLNTTELYDMLTKKSPKLAEAIHPNNKVRIIRALEKANSDFIPVKESSNKYEVLLIGLTWDKAVLHKRIEERLRKRIDEGMFEEVKVLLDKGVSPEFLIRMGLEYRHIYYYINGTYKTMDEFYEKMFTEIRRFAKRQMTWFRKNKNIHWLDSNGDYFDEAVRLIDNFLKPVS